MKPKEQTSMATVYFPAIIERGDGPGYRVFLSRSSGARQRRRYAAASGAERGGSAARHLLEAMAEDGLEIPAPCELDATERDPEVDEAARILVRAELRSSRAVRVNVTLPEDLLRSFSGTT
jgi:HicB_like antitoxin of bacterial toxin-antitoxin system